MGKRGRFLASVAVLAVLAGAPPAHADKWIYVQRHEGVRSYTDVQPTRGYYSKVLVRGRSTASASCVGLTAQSMDQRAAQYAPLIQKVSLKHGLSPQLVSAVMRVESCYDKRAVSRAGARGLMQLMPGTARQLGVRDSFDPEQNVDGGVRYLARMMARFNNRLEHALAAYNAGPEAVEAYRDIPPFPETKSYVTRILKLYKPA